MNAQSLAASARGADAISNEHFSRQTIPCADPNAAAAALLEVTRRDLEDDRRTRLLDHDWDDIRLKDGPGQIAVIAYAISRPDREVEFTTTEHFLVNEQCQFLAWSSSVSPDAQPSVDR